MAIQMRRGLMRDFDPYKMLPGEWAVSIDASTSNQIVWMCFSPGICKRMGTYEDFVAQIKEATEEVKTEYSEEFNTILNEVKTLSIQVSSDKNTVVSIKTDIQNTYLPQIQKALSDAQLKAESAKNSADAAAISEANAKTSEKNAKSSETAAKNSQTNAAASESNAKTSAANAATSATTATTKATDAANYASSAETSALTATNKAIEASQYAEEAAESAKQSQISSDAAAVSEANAKTSETNAKNYAEQAKTVSGEQVALNTQTLGYSKKNLFKNTATTKTASGITFTVNEDGSISVKGTATANPTFTVGKFKPMPNKTYIYTANSEIPDSGFWNNYCFIYNIDGVSQWRTDSPEVNRIWSFTPTTDTEITCQIYVAKGTTVENLTFYPMIRSAEITDGTYEPYVDDVDTRLQKIDDSILNTLEEIDANTSEENIAGALAIKSLKSNLTNSLDALTTNVNGYKYVQLWAGSANSGETITFAEDINELNWRKLLLVFYFPTYNALSFCELPKAYGDIETTICMVAAFVNVSSVVTLIPHVYGNTITPTWDDGNFKLHSVLAELV